MLTSSSLVTATTASAVATLASSRISGSSASPCKTTVWSSSVEANSALVLSSVYRVTFQSAATDEQLGEQVETSGAVEVADRGGPAVPDLDQPGLGHPLQRLAHGRAGDAQHLGEPALAGQRLPGTDLAVDDLGQHLVEDLVGDRTAMDRLEGHASSLTG